MNLGPGHLGARTAGWLGFSEKIRPREGTKALWSQATRGGGGSGGGGVTAGWGKRVVESKALGPGPQGWGGGAGPRTPQPKTEKQEQITIPRKTLQRSSGGMGFGEKLRPSSPGAQALLCLAPSPARRASQMRNCTWGQGRHRAVRAGLWPLGAPRSLSPTHYPQEGQDPLPPAR